MFHLKYPNSRSILNLAVVGYGTIAKDSHLRSIKQSGKFNICCAVDLITDENNGIPTYKTIKEAVKQHSIDAFAICTPPNTHFELAKEALKYGHVILEKPPVLNKNDLYELIEIAKNSKYILYFAYHTASSPAVAKLRSILENKNVNNISVTFLEQVTKWHDKDGWIFNSEISGGGVAMDIGINIISAICRTLPNIDLLPTKVELNTAEEFAVDTSADIEFVSKTSGFNGKIIMNWLYEKEPEVREIKYETKEGNTYLLDLTYARLYEIVNGEKILIETEDKYEYVELYDQFYDHIINKKSYCPTKVFEFICDVYDLAK